MGRDIFLCKSFNIIINIFYPFLFCFLIISEGLDKNNHFGKFYFAGEMDVSFLYTKDEPLGWTYDIYSYYFGFKYGLGALVLILLSPVARRLGLHEITTCCLGLVSKAGGLILHGLANTTLQMFIVAPLSMFNTFCIPSIRSLLSKQVEPNELGNYYINQLHEHSLAKK